MAMAPATPYRRPASTATMPALPQPRQLAALGTVLCLYRAQSGGELAGWAEAVRAEAGSAADSDGLRGRVLFYDRAGRCCWQLCLLPDSDFLAWEQLTQTLPGPHPAVHALGIGARLWLRLAQRLRGGRWQASALRLHSLCRRPQAVAHAHAVLAASQASLSALGACVARRIARDEGVEGDCFTAACGCR